MEWGDEWGEFWGDAVAVIETHAVDAEGRLVYEFKDKPTIHTLVNTLANRHQTLENLLQGMDPDMLYLIDTAVGVQLDTIGVILGRPRAGFVDDTYRVHLRTQALIALPSRRTMVGLLAMVRSLLDDAVRVITYKDLPPKAFTIEVTDLTLEEASVFRDFIEKARPTTYNGMFIVSASTSFGYSDSTAAVPTTTSGYGDSTGAVVGAGGPYAFVVPF